MSAVVAVLVTRLYLSLTGYPKIGSGPLHIAHLLWGGLLMLSALVVLLSVLGNRGKRIAAILGGLGFGLFVDEIGKFVTSDNDYFFQPAIALIYVLFVGLFLLFRAIERQSLSREERLVNAADMLVDVILGGATRAELVRTRWLLRQTDYQGPVAEGLREAIAGAIRVHEQPSRFHWALFSAWRLYDHLLAWPWFQRAILVVFVGQAALEVLTVLTIGWGALLGSGVQDVPTTLLTSIVSLVLTLIGVARLPHSRLEAYRWFERAVLISVFFTQVILFWQDQMAALGGLVWDVVLLAVLRFLIRQESARIVTER